MYDRGRHFADYNLVERYVKNPYLKGVERKPEDAFMGDDIKGCYLIPSDVVKEGMYVIDGGAYTGDSAMLFSDCVGETGRVFSFEPFKESFDELAALKLPRVTCVNMGLSDTTATLPFWVDDSNNSGNAVVADGTSFINVTSLDEYVEENNIPRVDFIKLDIEGSEMDALKGMQRTLARFKPDLAICIYHNRGYDSIDVPIYLYSLLGDSYDYAITHHTSTWFETVIHAVKPDYYIDEKMRKAAVIDRAYTYPVKAGSPEWFKLNAAGRYRHSNIPANIAGKMTTRALAETVITYPYIFDFYAFNTSKSAYSALTLKCNALKELMGRADASEAINEALDNIDKIGTPTGGYNEKKDAALEAEIVKKIMLNLLNTHEQNLSGYDTYLTPGSVNVISEQCPNGLTADFYTGLTYEDFDAAFDMLEYIQNYLIPIMYPSAVLVEAHTPVFNSHSYAWSTRPGTSWLNNPAPYLSKPGHNGNYTEHDPLVKLSRLLFYNRDFPESSQEYYAHAAVVTWVEGQNSLMYSKWGIMGVYEHSHNESPYAALSFKIYNGNK
jgi:FkbM family methyltransferase